MSVAQLIEKHLLASVDDVEAIERGQGLAVQRFFKVALAFDLRVWRRPVRQGLRSAGGNPFELVREDFRALTHKIDREKTGIVTTAGVLGDLLQLGGVGK